VVGFVNFRIILVNRYKNGLVITGYINITWIIGAVRVAEEKILWVRFFVGILTNDFSSEDHVAYIR
jgi:hypothetical protein